MKQRGLLLAIIMGLGMFGTPLAHAGWTELKASRNGHFVTRAYINGTPTIAIIDTGATEVVIPFREAVRLGLKPSFLRFDRPVWTANGKAMAARIRLRRVEINNVVVRDVEALVMPKGALHRVLIGMSFLSKLRRYIVKANTLRLYN